MNMWPAYSGFLSRSTLSSSSPSRKVSFQFLGMRPLNTRSAPASSAACCASRIALMVFLSLLGTRMTQLYRSGWSSWLENGSKRWT